MQSVDWRIESAGTWAPEGEPAAARTRQVLQAYGIDLSDHRSRPVSNALLASFNLILTMERGHKEALRAEFPALASRVYLLTEMVGQFFDIQDPIGGPLVDFEATAQEINMLLSRGFEKISRLSQDEPENISPAAHEEPNHGFTL
jgi:protein-tyrosine-phosphatase